MAKKIQKGDISVREAGRKGGNSTAARHGSDFYHEIGLKGGGKVKELIKKGKRMSQREQKRNFLESSIPPVNETNTQT